MRVAGVMILLTVAAAVGVDRHLLPRRVLVPAIVALAGAQVFVQARRFMHLDRSRRVYSLFFASGLFVATLIAVALMILLSSVQPFTLPQTTTRYVSTPARTSNLSALTAPRTPVAGSAPRRVPAIPKPSPSLPATSVRSAAIALITSRCLVCHTVNGLTPQGTVGPNLNDVMAGRVSSVPGGRPTDPRWLARWIADPPRVWSGALMPDLLLTPSQVTTLVDYLKTLH